MSKLHEVLAVEGELAAVFKKILDEAKVSFEKKANLFSGQVAVYTPGNEARAIEAKTEVQEVTETVPRKLAYVAEHVVRYLDCNFQKEAANQHAVADIVLDDGTVLGKQLPATFLLGLETKLKLFRDVLEATPTLPPGIAWVPDAAQKLAPYVFKRTDQPVAIRTEKTIKPIVMSPATDKHPAQVEKVVVDEPIGKTTTTQFSGMISANWKSNLLDRCDIVMRAVKKARQRANEVEVPVANVGLEVVDYILGK